MHCCYDQPRGWIPPERRLLAILRHPPAGVGPHARDHGSRAPCQLEFRVQGTGADEAAEESRGRRLGIRRQAARVQSTGARADGHTQRNDGTEEIRRLVTLG